MQQCHVMHALQAMVEGGHLIHLIQYDYLTSNQMINFEEMKSRSSHPEKKA